MEIKSSLFFRAHVFEGSDESRVCKEKAVEMERGPEEATSGEEQSNKGQHQRHVSENSAQDCAEKKANEQSKKDDKFLKKKKSSKMKNKVCLLRYFSLDSFFVDIKWTSLNF